MPVDIQCGDMITTPFKLCAGACAVAQAVKAGPLLPESTAKVGEPCETKRTGVVMVSNFACSDAAQCLLKHFCGLTPRDQMPVIDDDRRDRMNTGLQIKLLALAHLVEVLAKQTDFPQLAGGEIITTGTSG